MANIELLFVGASGIACSGTMQRISDGYYRQAGSEVFVSSPSFPAKAFPLVEGTGENLGSYRQTLVGSGWSDGLYVFRAHNTLFSNVVVGSTIFAIRDGAEVNIGEGSEAFDVYHADIQFNKNTALTPNLDEYTVTWFKNGVRITSGITSATIEVIKRADATDLIPAGTLLTQIGSTGSYKLDVTSSIQRQCPGDNYIVVASAVIDGGTRLFSWILGRDA